MFDMHVHCIWVFRLVSLAIGYQCQPIMPGEMRDIASGAAQTHNFEDGCCNVQDTSKGPELLTDIVPDSQAMSNTLRSPMGPKTVHASIGSLDTARDAQAQAGPVLDFHHVLNLEAFDDVLDYEDFAPWLHRPAASEAEKTLEDTTQHMENDLLAGHIDEWRPSQEEEVCNQWQQSTSTEASLENLTTIRNYCELTLPHFPGTSNVPLVNGERFEKSHCHTKQSWSWDEVDFPRKSRHKSKGSWSDQNEENSENHSPDSLGASLEHILAEIKKSPTIERVSLWDLSRHDADRYANCVISDPRHFQILHGSPVGMDGSNVTPETAPIPHTQNMVSSTPLYSQASRMHPTGKSHEFQLEPKNGPSNCLTSEIENSCLSRKQYRRKNPFNSPTPVELQLEFKRMRTCKKKCNYLEKPDQCDFQQDVQERYGEKFMYDSPRTQVPNYQISRKVIYSEYCIEHSHRKMIPNSPFHEDIVENRRSTKNLPSSQGIKRSNEILNYESERRNMEMNSEDSQQSSGSKSEGSEFQTNSNEDDIWKNQDSESFSNYFPHSSKTLTLNAFIESNKNTPQKLNSEFNMRNGERVGRTSNSFNEVEKFQSYPEDPNSLSFIQLKSKGSIPLFFSKQEVHDERNLQWYLDWLKARHSYLEKFEHGSFLVPEDSISSFIRSFNGFSCRSLKYYEPHKTRCVRIRHVHIYLGLISVQNFKESGILTKIGEGFAQTPSRKGCLISSVMSEKRIFLLQSKNFEEVYREYILKAQRATLSTLVLIRMVNTIFRSSSNPNNIREQQKEAWNFFIEFWKKFPFHELENSEKQWIPETKERNNQKDHTRIVCEKIKPHLQSSHLVIPQTMISWNLLYVWLKHRNIPAFDHLIEESSEIKNGLKIFFNQLLFFASPKIHL